MRRVSKRVKEKRDVELSMRGEEEMEMTNREMLPLMWMLHSSLAKGVEEAHLYRCECH